MRSFDQAMKEASAMEAAGIEPVIWHVKGYPLMLGTKPMAVDQARALVDAVKAQRDLWRASQLSVH